MVKEHQLELERMKYSFSDIPVLHRYNRQVEEMSPVKC